MSTLKVPGATLYYETEGSGQPLILIPGANGDGFIFMPISQFLKDKFTVVRYDRRGYSRSELDAPLCPEYHDQDCLLRLKEDAADVAALIRELDAGPAVVFGSSSGAQVALQVLIDYPELVDTLFCHEVPLLRTFEDFPEWEKKFLNLHTIFKEKGVGPAMFAFVQAISAGGDAGNFQETAAAAGGPYAAKNMDFWFEFELRQYSRYHGGSHRPRAQEDGPAGLQLRRGGLRHGAFRKHHFDHRRRQRHRVRPGKPSRQSGK